MGKLLVAILALQVVLQILYIVYIKINKKREIDKFNHNVEESDKLFNNIDNTEYKGDKQE